MVWRRAEGPGRGESSDEAGAAGPESSMTAIRDEGACADPADV